MADIAFAPDSTYTYPKITDEDVAFYRENGYLIVENALSQAEIEALRHEASTICRGRPRRTSQWLHPFAGRER